MGCITSKQAVSVTPARLVELEKKKKNKAESGDDSTGLGESNGGSPSGEDSFTLRVGNMQKYIQGEQVAAGWPPWLSAVAGEAIQGWVPLRADSFEKMEKIGQGTYSSVFRARELDTGRIVALKKVRFDNFDPESVRFMAREILILRRLDHPNIMKLEGLITSRMSCSIYLVFEYMEHDLAGLASCPNIKLSEAQVKCYMHQLLSGLEHCHSCNVMHRDIKGSNILVNNEGILKIADFGLANYFSPGHKQPLTSRVVTLWYRPPELLLGSTDYRASVDLWSVGCVFAELFLGKPILQGRTEYFTTKPYACDPSTLPKYPPNKEMDVRCREEAQRKRAGGRVVRPEAKGRPMKVCKALEEPSRISNVEPKEELQENKGSYKITGSHAHASKEDKDARLCGEVLKPSNNTNSKASLMKNASQGNIPFSGPLHVIEFSSFAFAKRQKEIAASGRLCNRCNSMGQVSNAVIPPILLQERNNKNLKGGESGDILYGAQVDSRGHSYDIAKCAILRQWSQYRGSFNVADVYHYQELSMPLNEGKETATNKNKLDQEDRVEFSGPILSQSNRVDELLERHERHIRQAVRRSWIQRGKRREK
ncbi:PREDICTED: probable serine/threonine-protein kinase At1g09600 isoform X2 [Nelumbo nucifera]|uniref:Probable serine/threonine-protein kinase At1g09600 isoform X2 n=1 Tax=Nelumbo nucifera TaxID=4432 RepID=A0A1U8AAM8_NELNU|nr:PREDICTED: probable serine/threonine-protein kinase At1g09600 isoform X2 [Nelumbo nucifera]